jgi:voltage-dependent potassium channel beta subunit
MLYRRLGRAGLQLSAISLGAWVTFGSQLDEVGAAECMAAAYDSGINFFDNAEQYAGGEAERLMGSALKRLGWRRSSYVVSTKFYWGLYDGVNEINTLNRKYLRNAIDGSLTRLGLDHVDLVFCHRPDENTAVEEVVATMHEMVQSGKALYWGTSEWPADRVVQAWQFAQRNHLHKPVVEQSRYNMASRSRVEHEARILWEEMGLGLTAYSPLASGTLAGRYDAGIGPGSRAALPGYERLRQRLTLDTTVQVARALEPVAALFGCSRAQLAIAWCLRNRFVSSVITGASTAAQVRENVGACVLLERLSPDQWLTVEKAVAG